MGISWILHIITFFTNMAKIQNGDRKSCAIYYISDSQIIPNLTDISFSRCCKCVRVGGRWLEVYMYKKFCRQFLRIKEAVLLFLTDSSALIFCFENNADTQITVSGT